ncbi:DUF397 domain-containing protein [Streptomyces sp. NPDC054841]
MALEPSAGDGPRLQWFKSSYSSSSDGNDCVEVASSPSCPTLHVRDSKNPEGPQLAFGSAAWSGFLSYASESRRPR